MTTLVRLDQLRAHLGFDAGQTADDDRLRLALAAAAAALERAAGRRFEPRRESLRHEGGGRLLILADDLLTVEAVIDGAGCILGPEAVEALPTGAGSFSLLRRVDGERFRAPVTVTGIWGWHDRRAEAWLPTGATLVDDPLSVDALTLTASAAVGFEAGHLLRIGAEYVRVESVAGAALTIARGVNGTTPADHLAGSVIVRYVPPAEVMALCLRWAAWLYREADQPLGAAAPPALLASLAGLRRLVV